jgi:hypothetical protein
VSALREREYIGPSQADGAERRIQIERSIRVNQVKRRKPKACCVLYPRGSRRKGSIRCAVPHHYRLAAE